MSAQKHALLANRGFSQHFNDGGCAYGVLFGNRNRAYERNCRHNKNGKRHDKRPNDFCKRDFPGAVDAVVVTRRNGGGFGIFAARCGAVLVCYEARWQRDFACVCCMHSFLRRRQRFKNGETRQTFKTYQVGVDLACGDSVRTFRDFFDGAGSDGRRSGQVWFQRGKVCGIQLRSGAWRLSFRRP